MRTIVSSDSFPVQVNDSAGRTSAGSAMGKTMDHRRLTHRSDADQHPISSITSLQTELNKRPDSALTNLEIDALLT